MRPEGALESATKKDPCGSFSLASPHLAIGALAVVRLVLTTILALAATLAHGSSWILATGLFSHNFRTQL